MSTRAMGPKSVPVQTRVPLLAKADEDACASSVTDTSLASTETGAVNIPRWIHHDAAESIEKPLLIFNREEGLGNGEKPSVLQCLCTRDFFGPCKVHGHLRNGFLNFFVLDEHHDGDRACCRHSEQVQGSGRARTSLIQVRRYMHRDVVLVEDMTKHYDCKGIQMYYINQKRAILLQPKAKSSSLNPVYDHSCMSCRVPLRPDCTFCSLSCSIHSGKHVCTSGLVIGPSKKRDRPPSGCEKEATGSVRRLPKLRRAFRPGSRAWSRKPEHPLRSPE